MRVRLVTDEGGGGEAASTLNGDGGGSDAAMAMTRLRRHVSEKNGNFVRMSAPQPTASTAPVTSQVQLQEGARPPPPYWGRFPTC